MMKFKHDSKVIYRAVPAFVDDIDFVTKITDSGSKMQEILGYYSSMHEAKWGKEKKEKVVMLNCKFKSNQIVEVVIKAIRNGEIVKSVDVKHSMNTLGVHTSQYLSWKENVEYTDFKMKRLIKKLIIAEMKLHQVCLYFNTCILTNMFFECDMFIFNKKQCEELKNIFKLPMIRKMGLWDNFPRKLLRVKKITIRSWVNWT